MEKTQAHTACKIKLLEMKKDLLNSFHNQRALLSSRSSGGDEADQSVESIFENYLYLDLHRTRERLLAVEQALARIENGTYGICEETHEPIEEQRLLAIPWTTLSIEGAEIRDQQKRSSSWSSSY